MHILADYLKFIYKQMFPIEGLSVHIAAPWRFLVMFCATTADGPGLEILPTWKRNVLRFVRIPLSMLELK